MGRLNLFKNVVGILLLAVTLAGLRDRLASCMSWIVRFPSSVLVISSSRKPEMRLQPHSRKARGYHVCDDS